LLLLFKLEFSDVIFTYFNKRFKNYFTITYNMPRKVVSKVGEEGIRNAEENVVKENIVTWTKGYKAEVLDVVGRTGMRGEATHVIVRVLDGPDSGKILRRNVIGPVRKGDIILLRETEISAMPIEKKD
jgi:small subunit ribosomal protein S28e